MLASMKNFVVKTLANAVAIAVATWVVSGITLTGKDDRAKAFTLVLVALVFGMINWVVKPVVKVLALPLFILTLGLITLVVNALMLWLTSGVAGRLDLKFHVAGSAPAFWGALIISVVAWVLHVVLPDDD